MQHLAHELIHLHSTDNVAVALVNLSPGTTCRVGTQTVAATQAIDRGHKVALTRIAKDQPIIKYGETIGHATSVIEPGDWVHTHNVELRDFTRPGDAASCVPAAPVPLTGHTFQGYRRASGRVGTRNYVGVISNVNCSASVCHLIAQRFSESKLKELPNVDGVVALTHHGGCGMQFGGMGHEMLNRVLGGMARHPNVGGFLLVGLGCEQAAMDYLLRQQDLVQLAASGRTSQDAEKVPVLSVQERGGTTRTVEAGVNQIIEMLPRLNAMRRETVPASHLVLATECGGSDANSGITANPALGVAADRIVACGGTAILGETTEIYGAEHLLTRRAVSTAVAHKLMDRLQWWKWYTGVFGVELNNNPSVGNKQGGLTTIAEKSLGAIAKGGSTALVDVLQYAEPVTQPGLIIMDTPGYDPPSVTGMVAGGANIVVFTTGRGSCFGCKPTPTIKVASNTPMYERMIDDMDINAGPILHGTPVQEVGEQIFRRILAVASGQLTKSETLGIGDHEFVPWIVGPTL